jgi:hypothetical protein
MRETSLEEFYTEVDAGIRQHICVQAWLGYANVLFLGFGGEVLVPVEDHQTGRTKHPVPLYELRTDFSCWQVIGASGNVVSSDDDAVDHAVGSLVGLRCVDWHFLQRPPEVQFEFEGGHRLEVTPYSRAKRNLKEDAWAIRNPTGMYFAIRINNSTYSISSDEPRA